jgi:hypothetical protein
MSSQVIGRKVLFLAVDKDADPDQKLLSKEQRIGTLAGIQVVNYPISSKKTILTPMSSTGTKEIPFTEVVSRWEAIVIDDVSGRFYVCDPEEVRIINEEENEKRRSNRKAR